MDTLGLDTWTNYASGIIRYGSKERIFLPFAGIVKERNVYRALFITVTSFSLNRFRFRLWHGKR